MIETKSTRYLKTFRRHYFRGDYVNVELLAVLKRGVGIWKVTSNSGLKIIDWGNPEQFLQTLAISGVLLSYGFDKKGEQELKSFWNEMLVTMAKGDNNSGRFWKEETKSKQ